MISGSSSHGGGGMVSGSSSSGSGGLISGSSSSSGGVMIGGSNSYDGGGMISGSSNYGDGGMVSGSSSSGGGCMISGSSSSNNYLIPLSIDVDEEHDEVGQVLYCTAETSLSSSSSIAFARSLADWKYLRTRYSSRRILL
jgi:hypothetical protein